MLGLGLPVRDNAGADEVTSTLSLMPIIVTLLPWICNHNIDAEENYRNSIVDFLCKHFCIGSFMAFKKLSRHARNFARMLRKT